MRVLVLITDETYGPGTVKGSIPGIDGQNWDIREERKLECIQINFMMTAFGGEICKILSRSDRLAPTVFDDDALRARVGMESNGNWKPQGVQRKKTLLSVEHWPPATVLPG